MQGRNTGFWQEWWHIPLIPAFREAEARISQGLVLGNFVTYKTLFQKLKERCWGFRGDRVEDVAQYWRPWVQSSVPLCCGLCLGVPQSLVQSWRQLSLTLWLVHCLVLGLAVWVLHLLRAGEPAYNIRAGSRHAFPLFALSFLWLEVPMNSCPSATPLRLGGSSVWTET